MPNSQIEMVVKRVEDGRERWEACGDLQAQEGRALRPVDIHVVVRQGDVIARGSVTVEVGGTEPIDWVCEVGEDGDGELVAGTPAIASAVAIAERENPPGLETLTWVQRVKVVTKREATKLGRFPDPELTVTKKGEVSDDRAVSSSLAILEEPGRDGARWEQVLEIREVVEETG